MAVHGIRNKSRTIPARDLKIALERKSEWDVGLSQKELAKRVGTTQQQISRLESPAYEGHSLSMLRRVADVLGATVHVEIEVKTPRQRPGSRNR